MKVEKIGPGYPILLEFMSHIGWLMFILTLVYFIPCAAMITIAMKAEDQLHGEEDDFH